MVIYCGTQPIEIGKDDSGMYEPYFLSMIDKRADGSQFLHVVHMDEGQLRAFRKAIDELLGDQERESRCES